MPSIPIRGAAVEQGARLPRNGPLRGTARGWVPCIPRPLQRHTTSTRSIKTASAPPCYRNAEKLVRILKIGASVGGTRFPTLYYVERPA
eukprot:288764-Prorocentrum_minimum.AAC.6